MLVIDQVGAAFLLVTLTMCLESAGIAALRGLGKTGHGRLCS
jgi:hypothetical protein